MFKNLTAIAFVLLFPMFAFGAEAKVYHEFELPVSYEMATEWAEKNGSSLAQGVGVEVVEEKDGCVTLKDETPKGDFVFKIKEEVTSTNMHWIYQSFFVESLEGTLEDQQTLVIITKKDEKVHVHMQSYAKVSNRSVKNWHIAIMMRIALKRAERHLKKELGIEDQPQDVPEE